MVPAAPVAHDNNVRGLTRPEIAPDQRRSVEEAVLTSTGRSAREWPHPITSCTSALPDLFGDEPEEVQDDAEPDRRCPPRTRWRGRLIAIPAAACYRARPTTTTAAGRRGDMENLIAVTRPGFLPMRPRYVWRRRADYGAQG